MICPKCRRDMPLEAYEHSCGWKADLSTLPREPGCDDEPAPLELEPPPQPEPPRGPVRDPAPQPAGVARTSGISSWSIMRQPALWVIVAAFLPLGVVFSSLQINLAPLAADRLLGRPGDEAATRRRAYRLPAGERGADSGDDGRMKLGNDPKALRAVIDCMAETLAEAIKRIAQTSLPHPDTGLPMSGRDAAEQLRKKVEDWKKL